jgi:quinol monooxygenase YgiN
MVTEFAEIDVKPGMEEAFIEGVKASIAIFLRAAGCHGADLKRSVEVPTHFVLNIKWDSVEAHNGFRASPDFGLWRGNVGHCFAAPPNVWHGEIVAE